MKAECLENFALDERVNEPEWLFAQLLRHGNLLYPVRAYDQVQPLSDATLKRCSGANNLPSPTSLNASRTYSDPHGSWLNDE
jgi:hypothetical protein